MRLPEHNRYMCAVNHESPGTLLLSSVKLCKVATDDRCTANVKLNGRTPIR